MLLRPKISRIYSNIVDQLQTFELSIIFLTISRKYAYLGLFYQKKQKCFSNIGNLFVFGTGSFYKCFQKPAAGADRF